MSPCVNTFPMPDITGLGRDPVSGIQAAQHEDLGLGPQDPCQKAGHGRFFDVWGCFIFLVLGTYFWIPVCFLKKNLKLDE